MFSTNIHKINKIPFLVIIPAQVNKNNKRYFMAKNTMAKNVLVLYCVYDK